MRLVQYLLGTTLLSCVLLAASNTQYIPQPYTLVGDSVTPNDLIYYKYNDTTHNIETIFSQEHLDIAQHATALDTLIVSDYEKLYKWKFDETLYVGLISNHNQIANGFSTQWPNNRQINYVGGAQMVDYFCSTSWIDTLLYHETAHNYQINIKQSTISQVLHSVFGNGLTFALWTMPNLAVNSFMLEGNALLNESWHGNGGRLYSGRFLAETILQAKAGNITPAKVYNQRLAFPYGDIHYILGGFYNYYLAQNYGLERANSFFANNSTYWIWPFFTNNAMQESIGVDFETSLASFAQAYKNKAKDFVKLKGKTIAKSEFFYPLNRNKHHIFTLINQDGRSMPEVLDIDTNTQQFSLQKGSFSGGKVFLIDGKFYTSASRYTNPTHITQGLFDADGYIKEGSDSRIVQTFLDDGSMVYFDTNSSFASPQLYIGENFYAQVHSSVIKDNDDNLYYFVQDHKTRTLYKNKTPLFSFKGFYGIVSDVDNEGGIYFIASSKLGSTLYCYKGGVLSRVLRGDNIIDARIMDDGSFFVATIESDGYYYMLAPKEQIDQTPYEVKLFFENNTLYQQYSNFKGLNTQVDTKKEYIPLKNLHYHGSEVSFGSVDGTTVATLNVKFADPLSQNSAQLFYQRDDLGIGIVGAGYSSSEYLLRYTLQLYTTVESDGYYDTNDLGIMANVTLPLYHAGYYYSDIGVNYFEDYLAQTRNPLSSFLRVGIRKKYGISMFDNYRQEIQLYGEKERDYEIYGGTYELFHDLVDEIYIGVQAQYSYATAKDFFGAKGIKLTSSYSFEDLNEPSVLVMPSFNDVAFIKKGGYAGVSLYKTVNFSQYYFTFPLSLQREAIYAKYRHYELQSFTHKTYNANESTIGMRFDSVVLNNMVVPIMIEYLYNDADFVQDKSSFRILLGVDF